MICKPFDYCYTTSVQFATSTNDYCPLCHVVDSEYAVYNANEFPFVSLIDSQVYPERTVTDKRRMIAGNGISVFL